MEIRILPSTRWNYPVVVRIERLKGQYGPVQHYAVAVTDDSDFGRGGIVLGKNWPRPGWCLFWRSPSTGRMWCYPRSRIR